MIVGVAFAIAQPTALRCLLDAEETIPVNTLAERDRLARSNDVPLPTDGALSFRYGYYFVCRRVLITHYTIVVDGSEHMLAVRNGPPAGNDVIRDYELEQNIVYQSLGPEPDLVGRSSRFPKTYLKRKTTTGILLITIDRKGRSVPALLVSLANTFSP